MNRIILQGRNRDLPADVFQREGAGLAPRIDSRAPSKWCLDCDGDGNTYAYPPGRYGDPGATLVRVECETCGGTGLAVRK